jgi:hypothetical protein
MKSTAHTLVCVALLGGIVRVAAGCADDRPPDPIPDEPLFLRKAFILRSTEGGEATPRAEDGAWRLTAFASPALGSSGLFRGAELGVLVRFAIGEDDVRLVDASGASPAAPRTVAAWEATHIDQKLSWAGETHRSFVEIPELDWRQRQWVRVNLRQQQPHDLALFGPETDAFLTRCAKALTTSAAPGSLRVDEQLATIEWTSNVVLSLRTEDTTCTERFGESRVNGAGERMVEGSLRYSIVRVTLP